MKRFLLVASLVSLSLTVHAAVLYFDDLEQFTNGTSLTEIDYFPNIGDSAQINTNTDGVASTTVVASNFLGNTRAFFRLGTPPYGHSYRGDQSGGDLTNTSVTLSFKLWVQQTKTASSIGGIGINVTTTNIDFVEVNGTNFSNNPLIFINDGGQVYLFTNNPAPPVFNNTQIGSWGTLAGSVMTNVLTLNYPAGTFSFSINGTELTNAPIPKFVTNIFSRVRLDLFEGLSGLGTLNSQGNRFALDDVRLSGGPTSTNQDVDEFIPAAKGQLFNQLGAGTPTMATTGFLFHADARGIVFDSIVAASVQPPTGASQSLARHDPGDSSLEFNDQFTTKAALDNAFHSSGTYTMSVDTQNQGLLTPTMNLPADDYPNTPQISNFAAVQTVGSTTNFILRWSAMTGGTSSDFITVDIEDDTGFSGFGTPDIASPGALDGTATSVEIPGGSLLPSTTYSGRLLFVKVKNTDTNSIPGAVGITGYFKQTEFPLITIDVQTGVDLAVSQIASANPVSVGDTFSYTITVTNRGTDVATGVTLLYFPPNNANEIAGCSFDTCDLGTLASGASTSVVVTVTATGTGSACNDATVFANEADENPANDDSTLCINVLGPNVPPVAVCQDVSVSANANCQANVTAAQVNNGSSDPDGDPLTFSLSPAGPYSLGSTPVTLTVADNRGGTNSCPSMITVTDQTAPAITCPANIITNIPFGAIDAVVNYPAATISDNCSLTFSDSAPASGTTFPLGTNTVTVTAADAAGNTNTCTFTITVAATPSQADLAVSGSSLVATASLNNTFTYSFVVTNKGPQDASNAEFVDTLPAGVSYVLSSSTAGDLVFTNGQLVCDFDTLAAGASATVNLTVTATVAGNVCNVPEVETDTVDPVAGNNSVSACTTVTINDFAVTAFKAPKKATLSSTKPSITGKLSVTVQNRSNHAEVIPDLNTLSNLVSIALDPLGTNACPTPVVQFVVPKKLPPLTVASGKTLKLAYTVILDCATDPAATSKTENHNDYQYLVTVHHEVVDGLLDSHTADDVCPHDALGVDPVNSKITDKGCGVKQPDGSFGPVTTDVVIK